jgi:hypothetical protein
MNRRRKLSEVVVLSSLAVACNLDKSPLGPAVGAVQVSVTATGVELQTHGYSVSIDSGVGQAIPVNGTVLLAGLSAGSHSVLLDGLAPNCAVAGTNPLKIAVRLQETTQVSFAVACVGPVDISGVWDFTELWSAPPCGDTGSYSFTQTGDTFVGTAIRTSSCSRFLSFPDSVHGRVVGSSVTFHGIAPGCGANDHTADVSGDPSSQMSGTGTCNQFGSSSTWHAVRHAAVGSVTVVLSPDILPVGAKSVVFALVRDTAGHPVFFRTVAWSSANQAVATAGGVEAAYVEPTGVLQGISPGSGVLQGISPGSVTITATVEGRSGSYSVTVLPWDISGTWAIIEALQFNCDENGCAQCSDSGSVKLSQNGPALSGTVNVSGNCFQESYGVSGDTSLPPWLAFGGVANGRSCSYSGALALHRPLSIGGDVVCSVGDATWVGSWQAVLAGQTAQGAANMAVAVRVQALRRIPLPWAARAVSPAPSRIGGTKPPLSPPR